MSQLRGPLEQHLAPAMDDAQIQKVALGLKAARRAKAPGRALRLGVAGALAAAALIAAVHFGQARSAPPLLARSDGAAFTSLSPGSTALSDGSRVTLDDGASAEVVANEASQLTLLVRNGKARFEVTPGGPRRWIVEAGIVRVEVVGTVFSVARDATGVRVFVERGTVIVRGTSMPDGLVRLDAGMSVFAPAPAAAAAPPSEPQPSPPPVIAPPPAPRPPSAEALLQQSDEARAAGQSAVAAQALTRLLQLWPTDASAPSAAFTLGRLELEKLNRPALAAKHFELAAASPSLAADASVRQVEALAASGDVAAAEAAARAAISQTPNTAQAGRLERWLQDPQHASTWLH